jgi:hypothetical protein
MFDNVINAAKGYFPGHFIMFAVAAIVTHAIYQVLFTMEAGFDVMALAQFTVAMVVAGLLGSMIAGAASD